MIMNVNYLFINGGLAAGRWDGHSSPMDKVENNDVVGVLLAGGLSRRFGGGDKCLNVLAGRTLLARVAARARPQVGALILNASGEAARFPDLGPGVVKDIVPDVVSGALGPLAGVLTGMAWARSHVRGARWVATFATDAPFLPLDMVARLKAAGEGEGASIAIAASAGRAHPVFALWSMNLLDDLRTAVADEGVRKVMAWAERYRVARVDFAAQPVDPFFNVNSPDDLRRAESLSVDR